MERIKVPGADGFRGLAALAVLTYHCMLGAGRPHLGNVHIRNVLVSGYMGVDFFFVLSGFLLFLPVATSGRFPNVRAYALRRACRILPAYAVAVVGTGLLLPYFVAKTVDYPLWSVRGAESLLLHLTFLQHGLGAIIGFQEGFSVNGVVWTLSLEVGFYILLPLVATWYQRHPFVGLGVALGLAAVWRHLAVHGSIPLGHGLSGLVTTLILIAQLPTYLGHFAAGMTAAWLYVAVRQRRVRLPSWGVVAAQAVSLGAVVWCMETSGARDMARNPAIFSFTAWTSTTAVGMWFAVLLLATALAPGWAQWPVRNPLVRRLGDISYGMYLWHILFVAFALVTLAWIPAGTTMAFVRMFAFTFAGAAAMGTLSHVILERPAMRWARRRPARPARPLDALGPLRPDSTPTRA